MPVAYVTLTGIRKQETFLVFESPVFIYKSYTMKDFGLECDRHKKESEKNLKKVLDRFDMMC